VDAVAIHLKHCDQDILLAREEMIEAAAIDAGALRMSATEVELKPFSANSSMAATTIIDLVSTATRLD
jgi:hypothetical protein